MQTVHTFTNLGLRTMPIGKANCEMVRDENGKKQVQNGEEILSFKDVMPANWTKTYGEQRKTHKDTPLGGLICGKLKRKQDDEIEVIALDCDNQAAWDMLRALDPEYTFYFESIGKGGGTILYMLPDELRELNQYSINNGTIHFEYMAKRSAGANAMVYLPTTANKTKQSIVKGAELSEPPPQVVSLIKSLEPKMVAPAPTLTSATTVLPFNAPLVKQYILESKAAAGKGQIFGKIDTSLIADKVYGIFTPKKFRGLEVYQETGKLHPNDSTLVEAGAYSEYITGVSAIAGADPSIDTALYVDFMQVINAQLDDPYKSDRYLSEVIDPMVYAKAMIKGKPIWKYNENWDKDSHSVSNQYGETLEYFANELSANEFLEYNHTTKNVVYIKGLNPLLDRVYTLDADPQQEKPNRQIVKKLKLVQEEKSVRLNPGVFINEKGRTIINTEEACLPLRILRNPEIFPQEVTTENLYVQAFEAFLRHLLGDDDESLQFLRELLAYHGRHLKDIPVIIYMIGIGGAGKSQFSNILEELFGSNTTRRPNPKQFKSQYNDFLENCALLVLSETSDATPQDQEGMKGIIKTVTGEKSIDIETKNRPLRPNVPIFALPLLLANSLWYEEDTADRRLFPIQPTTKLHKSEPILAFEETHGIKLVDFIISGVKQGYISKYLSQFCPTYLPEVPMTSVKKDFASQQRDPIARIKALVQNKEHEKLFDLFDEYDISDFMTAMERKTARYAYFRQHLVDLAISLKEGEFYPSDRDIGAAFAPNNWLEMKDAIRSNTNPKGPASYKRLGRYKWEFDDLKDRYEAWKLSSLGE